MKKGTLTSDKKKFFTIYINEKKKDLGLLKKVRKQERLSLQTRHEHSISVQGMNIQISGECQYHKDGECQYHKDGECQYHKDGEFQYHKDGEC